MIYLFIFLQSNLLEFPVYLPCLRKLRPDLKTRTAAAFITGMNALTHPVVFFVLMNRSGTYLGNVLIAEGFAVVSETLFLWKGLRVRPRTAFLVSFAANLLSWQVAPMTTYLLFRP